MARTTNTEVSEILDTSLTGTQIDAYISIASAIITEHLTSCGLSDEELVEIERWLTAHLISITKERQAKSEKLGEAAVTYQGNFGSGLNSTTYGQTVMLLDTCGILAQLGKRTIKVHAITSFDS